MYDKDKHLNYDNIYFRYACVHTCTWIGEHYIYIYMGTGWLTYTYEDIHLFI